MRRTRSGRARWVTSARWSGWPSSSIWSRSSIGRAEGSAPKLDPRWASWLWRWRSSARVRPDRNATLGSFSMPACRACLVCRGRRLCARGEDFV
ncbi:MAG: hypothetical protein MZV49_05635 [Rhodopseudomonas palustris]|nr:hypothetical protein [Rhodopseudomonas palustris]